MLDTSQHIQPPLPPGALVPFWEFPVVLFLLLLLLERAIAGKGLGRNIPAIRQFEICWCGAAVGKS